MSTTQHRLLLYELASRRWRGRLLGALSLLLIVAMIDQFFPILGPFWLLAWVAVVLVAAAWYFVAYQVSRATVQVLEDRLHLESKLISVDFPFGTITAIRATKLAIHFPFEELSYSEVELLRPVYQETCVFVGLTRYPPVLKQSRLWIPRHLFAPNTTGLLLVVKDWLALNQELSQAHLAWKQAREKRNVPAPSQAPAPAGITSSKSDSSPLAVSPALETAGNNPVKQNRTTAHRGLAPAISPSAAGQDAPLLLVADDNQFVRTQLNNLLAARYRVALAKDGEDGYRQALALHPDLILSDMSMPNMNGRELLGAIRANPELRSTPVIFLTASSEIDARVRSLEAGADDYLTKPCNDQELLARVYNLLHARAQERKLAELNRRLEARIEEQIAELVVSGDLRRFLPSAVAESVMAGEIGPAEVFERKVVTVLFVDIVGFTPLTEELRPTKLAGILNEYLREMTAISIVHGGTVDKFIGDALMVLFGAPGGAEPKEQAMAAVQTAVAMQRQMEALSRRWHATLHSDFTVRIGINSGLCTVGVFGSDLLKSYTAIGPPVNVASRLQAEARPGGILCSRTTYELIGEEVRAEPRGGLRLKGVQEPVEAFDILELKG